MQTSSSLFHNNIVNLNRNFEELLTLLDDLDFHFNVVGVSETKLTTSNGNSKHPSIPGYAFEYVPTPLASRGVGLFIDELLDYKVMEKSSNQAFQALWIEISLFANEKNAWNHLPSTRLPEVFQTYFEETVEKFALTNKAIYMMGDFNIDLLKCEISHFSHNFLLHLQSCYLVPTVDKPRSATLIDNIFVNGPDKILAGGNIFTDVSDHFSQVLCHKIRSDGKIQRKNY